MFIHKKMSGSQSENYQLMRFCLYGFLKNQLYFDAFLILAFLEKGLNFLDIGFLISFRAISVNILEIPSGAVADVWGRKRSMILSMSAYITSFVIFALAEEYWLFFTAMGCFALGEAFRTGTHKAMIFDWLHHYAREKDKTIIYGLTRSWSKIGSALSVIIAAVIVVSTNSYIWIFWISIIPYLLNVINFIFYPDFLNGNSEKGNRVLQVTATLSGGVGLFMKKKEIRTLIFENICFEGFYSSAKEYLQPLLQVAALTIPVMLSYTNKARTAVVVATTYAFLHILGSIAARKSHQLSKITGNNFNSSTWILLSALISYSIAGTALRWNLSIFPIISFIMLSLLLNIWKPLFVSRFYDLADKKTAATTLSIANQSKSLSVVIIAPLMGWAVESIVVSKNVLQGLWPVFLLGSLFSILGIAIHLKSKKEQPQNS